MTTIEEVVNVLGEFAQDFNITQEGSFIIAKAKTYIQPEGWKEIARRLRTVKAEWIKDGKDSRWQIPTGTVEVNKKLEAEANHIQHAMYLLVMVLDELEQAGYSPQQKST